MVFPLSEVFKPRTPYFLVLQSYTCLVNNFVHISRNCCVSCVFLGELSVNKNSWIIFFFLTQKCRGVFSALTSACSISHKLHTALTTSSKKLGQLVYCLRDKIQGQKVKGQIIRKPWMLRAYCKNWRRLRMNILTFLSTQGSSHLDVGSWTVEDMV